MKTIGKCKNLKLALLANTYVFYNRGTFRKSTCRKNLECSQSHSPVRNLVVCSIIFLLNRGVTEDVFIHHRQFLDREVFCVDQLKLLRAVDRLQVSEFWAQIQYLMWSGNLDDQGLKNVVQCLRRQPVRVATPPGQCPASSPGLRCMCATCVTLRMRVTLC